MSVFPARVDVPWDELEGRVFVALPRRRARVERWLARFLPAPVNTLLTFEGEPAAFWRLADGTRTLAQLAAEMGADEARVGRYARALAARGLVRLAPAPEPAPDTRRGLTPERGFARHACRRCGILLPVRGPPRAFFLCPRCKRPNRLGPAGPTG